MPVETPVPKDHPLWIAWKEYQSSGGYANTLHWAVVSTDAEHVEGSLWAAFEAGFNAGAAKR